MVMSITFLKGEAKLQVYQDYLQAAWCVKDLTERGAM